MVLAVVPSRLHSQRFTGKALVPIAGAPLVARVVRAVLRAEVADRVLVATDDDRIASAARAAGAEVRLDPAPYACGTDRVAGAVRALEGQAGGCCPEVVVNVQGDEPLVDGPCLRAALRALQGNDLGTVAVPGPAAAQLEDPDTVKVAVDAGGRALDFGRGPLFGGELLVHVGVYAFWRESLQRFARLAPTARELGQRLEQLRALDAGMTVGVARVDGPRASVNRPADVGRVERLLRRRGVGPAAAAGDQTS